MELLSIVIVAIIIESAVETFNKLFKRNGNLSYKKIAAIILSISVCICSDLDLLGLLGITVHVPYIGEIVTGLIVSRGSSVVNSLIEQFVQIKTSNGGSNPEPKK